MNLSSTTALVTGANGFVGSRVVRRLASRNATVRAVVRRPGECDDLTLLNVQEIQGDFTDVDTVHRAAEGVDFVVHCAATVGKDLDDARRVNVEGTRSVVNGALEAGVPRFVHISTMAVYEIPGRDDIDETSPLTTEGDPYSVSKAEAEGVIRDGISRGLRATILRPPCILGAHPTSAWGSVVPERIRDGQQKLLDDGGNTFPYVHVENLMDALELVLASPDVSIDEVFNVIDGHSTWRHYTDEVRRWFGSPDLERVSKAEIPAGAYWTVRFSSAKIESSLGYRSRLTFDDGMEEAARWWREPGSRV